MAKQNANDVTGLGSIDAECKEEKFLMEDTDSVQNHRKEAKVQDKSSAPHVIDISDESSNETVLSECNSDSTSELKEVTVTVTTISHKSSHRKKIKKKKVTTIKTQCRVDRSITKKKDIPSRAAQLNAESAGAERTASSVHKGNIKIREKDKNWRQAKVKNEKSQSFQSTTDKDSKHFIDIKDANVIDEINAPQNSKTSANPGKIDDIEENRNAKIANFEKSSSSLREERKKSAGQDKHQWQPPLKKQTAQDSQRNAEKHSNLVTNVDPYLVEEMDEDENSSLMGNRKENENRVEISEQSECEIFTIDEDEPIDMNVSDSSETVTPKSIKILKEEKKYSQFGAANFSDTNNGDVEKSQLFADNLETGCRRKIEFEGKDPKNSCSAFEEICGEVSADCQDIIVLSDSDGEDNSWHKSSLQNQSLREKDENSNENSPEQKKINEMYINDDAQLYRHEKPTESIECNNNHEEGDFDKPTKKRNVTASRPRFAVQENGVRRDLGRSGYDNISVVKPASGQFLNSEKPVDNGVKKEKNTFDDKRDHDQQESTEEKERSDKKSLKRLHNDGSASEERTLGGEKRTCTQEKSGADDRFNEGESLRDDKRVDVERWLYDNRYYQENLAFNDTPADDENRRHVQTKKRHRKRRRQRQRKRIRAQLDEIRSNNEHRFSEENRSSDVNRTAKDNRFLQENGSADNHRIANETRFAQENRFANENRFLQENRIDNKNRFPQENRIDNKNRFTAETQIDNTNSFSEGNRPAYENRTANDSLIPENNRSPEEKRIDNKNQFALGNRFAIKNDDDSCRPKENRSAMKNADDSRFSQENRSAMKNADESRFSQENRSAMKNADESRFSQENRSAMKNADESRFSQENRSAINNADEHRFPKENRSAVKNADESPFSQENRSAMKNADESCFPQENRSANTNDFSNIGTSEPMKPIKEEKQYSEFGVINVSNIHNGTFVKSQLFGPNSDTDSRHKMELKDGEVDDSIEEIEESIEEIEDIIVLSDSDEEDLSYKRSLQTELFGENCQKFTQIPTDGQKAAVESKKDDGQLPHHEKSEGAFSKAKSSSGCDNNYGKRDFYECEREEIQNRNRSVSRPSFVIEINGNCKDPVQTGRNRSNKFESEPIVDRKIKREKSLVDANRAHDQQESLNEKISHKRPHDGLRDERKLVDKKHARVETKTRDEDHLGNEGEEPHDKKNADEKHRHKKEFCEGKRCGDEDRSNKLASSWDRERIELERLLGDESDFDENQSFNDKRGDEDDRRYEETRERDEKIIRELERIHEEKKSHDEHSMREENRAHEEISGREENRAHEEISGCEENGVHGGKRFREDEPSAGENRPDKERQFSEENRFSEMRQSDMQIHVFKDNRSLNGRQSAEGKRFDKEIRFSEEKRPDQERRFSEEQRPDIERWVSKEKRSDEERRFPEEQRPDKERWVSEEKRPDEEQRFSEEKRPLKEKRFSEERRPDKESWLSGEKRPDKERGFSNEKRSATDRRFSKEKRIATDRRFSEEKRPSNEKQSSERKTISEQRQYSEEQWLAEKRRFSEENQHATERRPSKENYFHEVQRFFKEQRSAEEKRSAENEKSAEKKQSAEEKRAAEGSQSPDEEAFRGFDFHWDENRTFYTRREHDQTRFSEGKRADHVDRKSSHRVSTNDCEMVENKENRAKSHKHDNEEHENRHGNSGKLSNNNAPPNRDKILKDPRLKPNSHPIVLIKKLGQIKKPVPIIEPPCLPKGDRRASCSNIVNINKSVDKREANAASPSTSYSSQFAERDSPKQKEEEKINRPEKSAPKLSKRDSARKATLERKIHVRNQKWRRIKHPWANALPISKKPPQLLTSEEREHIKAIRRIQLREIAEQHKNPASEKSATIPAAVSEADDESTKRVAAQGAKVTEEPRGYFLFSKPLEQRAKKKSGRFKRSSMGKKSERKMNSRSSNEDDEAIDNSDESENEDEDQNLETQNSDDMETAENFATEAKIEQSETGKLKRRPSLVTETPKTPGFSKTVKHVFFDDSATEIHEFEIEPGHRMRKFDPKDIARWQKPTKNNDENRQSTTDAADNKIYSKMEEFLSHIFQWNPRWLEEQIEIKAPPPIVDENKLTEMLSCYRSYEEYYKIAEPLLTLEMWYGISKDFEVGKTHLNFFSIVSNSINLVPNYSTNVQVSTLILEVVVSRRDLELQAHPVYGDLLFFEYHSNRKDERGYASWEVFAYVTSLRKTPITSLTNLNRDLINAVKEPHTLLTYTVMTKALDHADVQTNRVNRLRTISYLRSNMRMVQALQNLPESPLMDMILHPKVEDYQLPAANNVEAYPLVTKDALNTKQLEAVVKITNAVVQKLPKVCLIQGPPGTGKSKVIVNLVTQILYGDDRYHSFKKLRILVCAPSNAAVDEIVLRLLDVRKSFDKENRFNIVRTGRTETIHPSAKIVSLRELAKKRVNEKCNSYPSTSISGHQYECERMKRRNLAKMYRDAEEELLKGADVIASTLTSCYTNQMELIFGENAGSISVCIVDEATQSAEPENLIPLMLGVRTLVLVGDTNQLPATILSQKAKQFGLDQSLFARIWRVFEGAANNPIIQLDTQYRMTVPVAHFPNKYFYAGALTHAAKMHKLPFHFYRVINLDSTQDINKFSNLDEADFVANLVYTMIARTNYDNAVLPVKVGIITPYNNQKILLRRQINERVSRLKDKDRIVYEVNTVDSFQGQERDVIIMSCVRSSGIGFLSDRQRLCVALTRAKHSLILCGNFRTFHKDPMWRALLSDAQTRNVYLNVKSNSNPGDIRSHIIR